MPGPSNLYGTANAPVTISIVQFGTDTVCNANVSTVFASFTNFAAPSAGWFFPVIFCAIPVGIGATSPTTLQLGFNINGGSQVDYWRAMAQLMVANTTDIYWPTLFGPPSNTAWAGAGSTINLICTPGGFAMTVFGYSLEAKAMLFRAPDQ